jgi:hypothetical protein
VLDTVAVDRGCFGCMLGGQDGRTLFIAAAQWHGMQAAMSDGPDWTGQLLAAPGQPAPHAGHSQTSAHDRQQVNAARLAPAARQTRTREPSHRDEMEWLTSGETSAPITSYDIRAAAGHDLAVARVD